MANTKRYPKSRLLYLTEDQDQRLVAAAEQSGLSVVGYVRSTLIKSFAEDPAPSAEKE